MTYRAGRYVGLAMALVMVTVAPASAVDVSPHRALYRLTLDSAKVSSGLADANGAMYYEWGETCGGWTVDQRFRLRLLYADEGTVDISSSLVTWESKDGLRYNFNEKRSRNGEIEEDIHGQAHLDGKGKGGIAEFEEPERKTLKLAPGTLFPTAHTLFLIESAEAGEHFVSRKVFDGTSLDNAEQISAVIGPQLKPDPKAAKPLGDPLLQHPSWRMHLAFFAPQSSKTDSDTPEYELTMRLLENGISQSLSLNYGDYVLQGKLEDIEALPKPHC